MGGVAFVADRDMGEDVVAPSAELICRWLFAYTRFALLARTYLSGVTITPSYVADSTAAAIDGACGFFESARTPGKGCHRDHAEYLKFYDPDAGSHLRKSSRRETCYLAVLRVTTLKTLLNS